jgi:hypothetical protein
MALHDLGLVGSASKDFLEAYDGFLVLLSDSSNRTHLEELVPEEMATDALYRSARTMSHKFQGAIEKLFLQPGSGPLSDLTIKYGVF